MDKLAQAFVPSTRIDLAREADFVIGPLQVRPSRREVLGAGGRHVLQRRVMQVFVALAQSKGDVVSQHELVLRCWDGLSISDDAIARCIAQLRRLAATWPEAPFTIETIAGVGYSLAAGNGHVSEPATAIRLSFWRWRREMGLAVAVIVSATLAIVWLSKAIEPKERDHVAVLPFDAPANDLTAGRVAVGLTDEVLGVVSSNRQQAISRTEASALRGADRDSAVRRLGVGLMLDGSVESDGDRLHIRAHLDDASQQLTLWSKEFDGPSSDPAALQATVAARLSDVATFALEARTAQLRLDPSAMVALLRASDNMSNPTDVHLGTSAELIEVSQDLHEVTRRAPAWGVGHARLAVVLSENPATIPEARQEAQRALALDPHAAEAYLALSNAEPPLHWAVREHLLDGAVAANPELSFAPLFEARLFTQVGRLADALAPAQRAVALRPLFSGGQSTLGDVMVQDGQVAEGRAVLDRAAILWPQGIRIKVERLGVAMGQDDMDQALTIIQDRRARPPYIADAQTAVWITALTARRSRDPGVMRRAALQVRKAADSKAMAPQDAFRLCAMLRDLDCAFTQADQYYSRSTETGLLFTKPADLMQRDRRFMLLAAKLGLVAYWRSTGHWPDFCTQPELPYNCRTEAERVTSSRS